MAWCIKREGGGSRGRGYAPACSLALCARSSSSSSLVAFLAFLLWIGLVPAIHIRRQQRFFSFPYPLSRSFVLYRFAVVLYAFFFLFHAVDSRRDGRLGCGVWGGFRDKKKNGEHVPPCPEGMAAVCFGGVWLCWCGLVVRREG